MRNITVIENFIRGLEGKSSNGNLRTNGNELVNYSTVIARHNGNVIYVNKERYSKTTSTIQNMLKREIDEFPLKTISEVEARILELGGFDNE